MGLSIIEMYFYVEKLKHRKSIEVEGCSTPAGIAGQFDPEGLDAAAGS
ncbi:hypothetical protein JI667_10300 [Bacillus sp. NTK074B]|nr:hypothetical protein [Bacillus sp. NTK074B]